VSGALGIRRWDNQGDVLQTFGGICAEYITDLIELKSDTVISASKDKTIRMWRVSTEECLWATKLEKKFFLERMVKLSTRHFVGYSKWDRTIQVWNDKGECIETIGTFDEITAITRLGDSIVTVNRSAVQIRRLKFSNDVLLLIIYHHLTDTALSLFRPSRIDTSRTSFSLVGLCCLVISNSRELYGVDDLKQVLPKELFDVCFSQRAFNSQVVKLIG